MTNTNVTPATLRVIRFALLGGVLMLGAVAWYLRTTGAAPDTGIDLAAAPWVFLVACLVAAGGILFVRGAQTRADTFAQRASLAIVAWALAEGTALLGGIHWLLSGRPTLYLAGLAVFLVAITTVGAGDA